MVGFIYRIAMDIKDFGERLAHRRPSGKRSKLRWLAEPICRIGLALRDLISVCPIRY